MNSTVKTAWIVIGVAIIAWILIALIGKANSSYTSGNNSAETSVQADRTPGGSTNTTGVNGSVNTTVNTGSNIPTNTVLSESALSMLVGNAKIRVPETGVDVALSAGNADYTYSAVNGHIALGRILGRVQTENGTDVYVEMNITKGGTGVFNYVALFHNVGQTVNYTSAKYVGDRLTITGITATPDKSTSINSAPTFMNSAVGYKVSISYLDRKNGEPMTTTPSVSKTVTVNVKNHTLSAN